MTRPQFLSLLRRNLRGLPAALIEDIVADYEAHFRDAALEDRGEEEVARALGDPRRLARELYAEARLRAWEERPAARSALGAFAAVLTLCALDLSVMLPVLLCVAGLLVSLLAADIVALSAGAAYLAVGPFDDPPGGPLAAILNGVGIVAGATAFGAALLLAAAGLLDGLARYARLHYRLLRPALASVRVPLFNRLERNQA